jgi:hypothetical protein
MNPQTSLRVLATALVLVAAVPFSNTASAIQLRTQVASIYQIGTGSQVNLGHTVSASTNYNRLYAGGTYVATCAAPEMLPTTAQRFLTSEGVLGGRSLYVTIPAVHPGRVNMPGFDQAAMRGQKLDCTYNWTSRAVEGQYSIGANGVGFISGGGEMNEGDTVLFTMLVRDTGDVNGGSTCIP